MFGSRRWAWISAITSTFQIYLAPVGILPSLSVISGCGAFGALIYIRELLNRPWFVFTCLLFLVQLISMAWSPSHKMGARVLVYQFPFIVIALAIAHATRKDSAWVARLIRWSLVPTAVQALFVMIFRVLPGVKVKYLASPAAYPFNNINRLQDVFDRVGTSNIMDASKSGGLITYANPTAAWMGLAAIVSWYVARHYKSKTLMVVSFVDFMSVFFTGSKSGAVMALALMALVVLMDSVPIAFRRRRLNLPYVIVPCFALSLIFVTVPFIPELPQTSHFLNESSATLGSRQELWRVAEQEFAIHPLKGLGFGGWEQVVPRTGRGLGLPPHNAFVLLWAQSGLVAALLGIAFTLSFMAWTLNRIWDGDTDEERMAAKALFGGFVCLLVLTQGENFGLFGDEHMRPLLAMLAGFLAGLRGATAVPPFGARAPVDEAIAPTFRAIPVAHR